VFAACVPPRGGELSPGWISRVPFPAAKITIARSLFGILLILARPSLFDNLHM